MNPNKDRPELEMGLEMQRMAFWNACIPITTELAITG